MTKDTYFCVMYHFFNYKGIQIRYTSQGKGRVIVLLHGFLENLTMWNTLISELSKRNRIVCIDLLGHGESGNLGYIHTMSAQAQMIKALLHHLRLRKYILIGHSLGGYISLAFAETYPDTLKGLCLLNSTAEADTEEKKINRDRAVIAVKRNYKMVVKIAIPNLFSEKTRPHFKKEIEQIITEALQMSPQGIINSLEGMKIRKDQTKLLKDTSFAKMLIIGKDDPVLDYDSLLKQTENTYVQVIILPDGHMSHIENTDALLFALKKFVKSCN